eukprot:1361804-Amorphochlora_amoeboformis.AAC.1
MNPQSLRGGERSLCATAASIVEPSVGPQLGEAGTAKAIIRDVFQRSKFVYMFVGDERGRKKWRWVGREEWEERKMGRRQMCV